MPARMDHLAYLEDWTASDTEPATTAAGDLWLDTSVDPHVLKRRNDADDGWVTVGATGGGGGGATVTGEQSRLLALTQHNPGGTTVISVSATAYADVDATNLSVTFTVPDSGQVIVRLSAYADMSTTDSSADEQTWRLHDGTAAVAGSEAVATRAASPDASRVGWSVLISGLTPGASETWTWQHAVDSGTGRVIIGAEWGPGLIEVWDAAVAPPGGAPGSYVELVGDGSTLTFDVTHGLGTESLVVQAWSVTSGESIPTGTLILDADTVRLVFGDAPATDDARVVVLASGAASAPRMQVQQKVASGTGGGNATTGSWQTRSLNTEAINEISGASLASNQITLPAGTYWCEFFCAMYSTQGTQVRLRDVTNGVTLISSIPNWNSSGSGGDFPGRGEFTLAASAAVELQYRCLNAENTNSLGYGAAFGEDLIHSDVFLEKRAG